MTIKNWLALLGGSASYWTVMLVAYAFGQMPGGLLPAAGAWLVLSLVYIGAARQAGRRR